MKNLTKPDFRREVEEWFKNHISISAIEIARELRISTSTVYNWKKGTMSPTTQNFERLKNLFTANGLEPKPPNGDLLTREYLDTQFKTIGGRLEQLTIQIERLHWFYHDHNKRISGLEAGAEKKSGTRVRSLPGSAVPKDKV